MDRLMCFSLVVLSALLPAGSAKDAPAAWNELVGESFAKRPAFFAVENDAELSNALLYGDSISIAYTETVREALKGKSNVYRLYCNGGDSSSFIGKMDRMMRAMTASGMEGRWDFDWDVIHFNVGLHDLKFVAGGKLDRENGEQVSSLETYEENLHAVVAYLKRTYPRAKLIFATTTPVPTGSTGRDAGDAKRYNAVALSVMSAYPDIAINDLYALTKPHQPEWWTKPGNVHFTEVGYEAQGKQVAEKILKALD